MRQRRRFPALGLAAVACLLSAGLVGRPAQAGDRLNLCFETWPGYTSVSDTGEMNGAVIEILAEASTLAKIDLDFAIMPYARCQKEIVDGHFDGMPITSLEPEMVAYGPPLAYWTIGVFVHKAWPRDSYGSLDEFVGKSVGLVQGYDSYGAKVDQYRTGKSGWIVSTVPDAGLNLRKLSAGRIDMTIAEIGWAMQAIRREYLQVKYLPPVVDSSPLTVMLRPGLEAPGQRLAAALVAIKERGGFDAPYLRHLGRSWTAYERDARLPEGGS